MAAAEEEVVLLRGVDDGIVPQHFWRSSADAAGQ